MKRHDPGIDESVPGAKEVRQAYGELPDSAVPPELDARVLARAREAATKHNKVVAMKRAVIRRWAIPLSTAASVIVVMSVVYETQFSTPREASVVITDATQGAATPSQDNHNDHELAPASPASEAAARKPATAGARQLADAARANAARIQSIQPPPPAIASVIDSPEIVSLAESTSLAPPASVISVPLPSPVRSEPTVMANEARQDKKELKSKEQEDKVQLSKAAERPKASAVPAQGQLLGSAAKQADATPSPAELAPLVGHYNYEAYRTILLSGETVGFKELGYATATLDIDTHGTLTRRMTMGNGKVVTQTARILEVKLNGSSGHWITQWPDINYPVQAEISLNDGRLFIRTQYEELADTPRFGSVELARLKRVGL